MILRHRRRGSFVNPHWLSRRPDQPEVRVIVPTEGPVGADGPGRRRQRATRSASSRCPRQSLHQTLTHAVAEGRAPDLALLDSVWAPEFAAAGFIHALEELNEELGPRGARGRLPRASRAVEPVRGQDVRRLPLRGRRAGSGTGARQLETLGLEPPGDVGRAPDGRARDRRTACRDPDRHARRRMAGETTAYCLIAVPGLQRRAGPRAGGRDARLPRDGPGAPLPPQPRRGATSSPRRSWGTSGTDRSASWPRDARRSASAAATRAQTLAEALGVHHHEVWDHFGFTRVPAGPQGAPASVTGGMMFAIFRQAAQPGLAMRLLESVVEPEALARVARSTGRIPSRRSAIELVAPDLPFCPQWPRSSSRPWRGRGCRPTRGSRSSCRRCSRRSSPAGSAPQPPRSARRR